MAPARASNGTALAVLAASILLLGACTSAFEQEFRAAEALRAEAAAIGAEWIETGRLLDEAQSADAEGDTDRALALVEKARFQAEAAIEQARRESTSWRERVIR